MGCPAWRALSLRLASVLFYGRCRLRGASAARAEDRARPAGAAGRACGEAVGLAPHLPTGLLRGFQLLMEAFKLADLSPSPTLSFGVPL